MKRFTLIIDGHNFFFRSLWNLFKSKKNKVLDTKKDIDSYEQSLMIDFCQIIKQFGNLVTDVVFVIDSHSWRKDMLLNQEYKGNRKKNQDSIDRNGFNTATGNFIDTIESMGIKIGRAERCEGDDLIYAWSDNLFDSGISSLILSTDKDLTQLVKCVNGTHIIQYAPIGNKLFMSQESADFIKDVSNRTVNEENLFDEVISISIENDPFKKFVDSTECVIVNPETVRFEKIIGGDCSDNIYPVYYKPAYEGHRAKGLGTKTVGKIYEAFKNVVKCDFNYKIFLDVETLKVITNVIYDVAKINDDEFSKRMMIENLKTNTKLVALAKECIPDDVMENMNINIEFEKQKKPVVLSKITRENIFAKSRFKDYRSSTRMVSPIFKGIKDDGDMSFIKG